MDKLIIYPDNKEQLAAVKAILNAMKIDFEIESRDCPDVVIAAVRESLKQADEGQLVPYTGIRDMLT